MATILVVDDDEQIRAFLAEVLERAGHQIVNCSTGADALEMASETKPDLIILDVMMPMIDGFQVLWHLYSNMATRHIPTIVLTSRTGQMSRHYGYSLGASDYIDKPIELPRLIRSVEQVIGATRAPDPAPDLN